MPELSIDQLVQQLNSSSGSEVADAVRKLGQSRRVEALGPLCNLLHKSPDKNLAALVAKAMGHIGDRRVIPTLIELFKGADHNLRGTILKAFLRIGVFDESLPSQGRERLMFQRAIVISANPEIVDLIERGDITRDELRKVLPPIM